MTVATVPTKLDAQCGVILNMIGISSTWGDTAFDSHLLKHSDGGNNHTLTLVLKIHLNPILPASAHLPRQVRLLYPDWNKTMMVIKPWQASHWTPFEASNASPWHK